MISDCNNSVVATVNVGLGSKPASIVYDSGTGELYITNFGAGSVLVMSDTNDSLVANVPIGTPPYGLTYDAGRGEVYVA